MKTKPTESEIAAAVDRLNAAQTAHAVCLSWNNAARAFVPNVTEEVLSARYVASLEAERDYCAVLGDDAAAEQIGYQIEIEIERLRRFKEGS